MHDPDQDALFECCCDHMYTICGYEDTTGLPHWILPFGTGTPQSSTSTGSKAWWTMFTNRITGSDAHTPSRRRLICAWRSCSLFSHILLTVASLSFNLVKISHHIIAPASDCSSHSEIASQRVDAITVSHQAASISYTAAPSTSLALLLSLPTIAT